MTYHIINKELMSGNHYVMKDFSKPSKLTEHHNFQFRWHQQNIYQYHKNNLPKDLQ